MRGLSYQAPRNTSTTWPHCRATRRTARRRTGQRLRRSDRRTWPRGPGPGVRPSDLTAGDRSEGLTPPTRTRGRRRRAGRIASGELHADVLDARVLLHRVQRHVLAVAGLLEAAVRHLGREREQVLVDPD